MSNEWELVNILNCHMEESAQLGSGPLTSSLFDRRYDHVGTDLLRVDMDEEDCLQLVTVKDLNPTILEGFEMCSG